MHGLGFQLYGYKKPEEQIDITASIIEKHLDAGAKAEDIALISLRGMGQHSF